MKNTAAIILVSLAAWVAFYLMGAPATASESIVLVGISAIIVWAVRRLYGALRRTKSDEKD